MLKLNRKSQQGFSLVELMVVVAIIGVLAAIAVPNINKYIAKARQSEAKTILSSIYTGEKAFYAEYQAYHGQFGAIGYSPEGKLRYNAGFSAATNANATHGFNTTVVAPGNQISTVNYCGAAGVMSNGCAILNGANNLPPPGITAAVLNSTTFTARAVGVLMMSGTTALNDIWQMTHEKVLTNPTAGIR